MESNTNKRFQRKLSKRSRRRSNTNLFNLLLKIINTKVMLIDVMANNVMLSKNIQPTKLLINHLKAPNNTDYCFELSPHDFGGPPLLYVHEQQHQKETIKQQDHQYITYTTTTITNDDNS